jgi:hypothetical protein
MALKSIDKMKKEAVLLVRIWPFFQVECMRLEYEVHKRPLHSEEFFRAAEFAIKHVIKDKRLHKTRMETLNAIIASYVGTLQNEGKQAADAFIKTILESVGK